MGGFVENQGIFRNNVMEIALCLYQTMDMSALYKHIPEILQKKIIMMK